MSTYGMNTNGTVPTLGEMGIDRLQPPDGGSLTINGGMWTMPHYQTFVSFMKTMARSYWWTFDEALRDSQTNSDAMRNDLVVRDALTSRYRPVCLLEWQLEPLEKADMLQVAYANKLTNVIKDIPKLQQFKRCLMEAVFFGKYGVQTLTKWDYSLGYKRCVIKDWYPVHGDKIVFKWDGTPGILVNAAYRGTETEWTERGPAHFLTPEEQRGFIWHEFEPEDSSYYKPEFAGTIHGSGMRGRIYWYWWLRQNVQRFMMNFLKKAGNGYLLVGYPAANVAAKAAAQTAIEGQDGNNIIYVPTNMREGETIDKVVQHVQVSMTGAQMQWTVISGINELIKASIMGETATTEASNTGLGSDIGEQHGITSDDRVKYDAQDLEWPMQRLTNLLNSYNCPLNPPPRYTHLADKRQPEQTMKAVQVAMQVGLAVPENWFRDQLGIPKPIDNEPVLAQIQPMQPTAMGNTPAGTPMVGQPGPAGPMPPGQPQQPAGAIQQ
jgi:hypothetical protein